MLSVAIEGIQKMPATTSKEIMQMTTKAHSIKTFCEAHDISRNLFYTLKKMGLAPKTIALGKRRLITEEAAQEWRQEMQSRSTGG